MYRDTYGYYQKTDRTRLEDIQRNGRNGASRPIWKCDKTKFMSEDVMKGVDYR